MRTPALVPVLAVDSSRDGTPCVLSNDNFVTVRAEARTLRLKARSSFKESLYVITLTVAFGFRRCGVRGIALVLV